MIHEVLTKTWNEFENASEEISNQSKESIADSESTQTFQLKFYNVDDAKGITDSVSFKIA